MAICVLFWISFFCGFRPWFRVGLVILVFIFWLSFVGARNLCRRSPSLRICLYVMLWYVWNKLVLVLVFFFGVATRL